MGLEEGFVWRDSGGFRFFPVPFLLGVLEKAPSFGSWKNKNGIEITGNCEEVCLVCENWISWQVNRERENEGKMSFV